MRVNHGRGAQSSALSSRFGLPQREADLDWLDDREAIDGPGPKLRTTVTELFPKTILSFNDSPDIPFDRSVLSYGGCEHGCIYCFARPTHAFHDLSPGLDFETRLFAKPNHERIDNSPFPPQRSYWPHCCSSPLIAILLCEQLDLQ